MDYVLLRQSMRIWISCTLCLLLGANNFSFAQQNTSLFEYWQYHKDPESTLYNALADVGFRQLDKRVEHIKTLKDQEAWTNRQNEIRQKLDSIIGVFPEKTPLNANITGILKGDGFRVEKVVYESQPGLYVTAALFLPDGLTEKAPAILYCSGHTFEGFRSKTYQHAIINLVKKGFVVLAFDPVGQGERLQYLHKKGKKSIYTTPTHEHSYVGGQCFITGQSLAKYMIWDGIRSIDYLVSRVEVDPQRIGITGRSGGGTQSVYISAYDDRILAAAPENYVTSFRYLLESIGPQDAEQNLPNLLKNHLDFADLLEVRAPKPLLIVSTLDDFFSIQGARDTFTEVQNVYRIYNAEDSVRMIEDAGGHESTRKNRERTYAFFQKHLNNPGDSTDLDVEIFNKKDLLVTNTGQVLTAYDGESIFSLNQKVSTRILEARMDEPDSALLKENGLFESVMQTTGFENLVLEDEYIFSGTGNFEGMNYQRYLIKGNNSRNIPLLVMASGNMPPSQAVMILNPEGKESELKSGLPAYLARSGYLVIIPDITGSGELDPGDSGGDSYISHSSYNKWYAGILTGKSIVGLRMEDIDQVSGFAFDHFDIKNDSLLGISRGIFSADLLHNNIVSANFSRMVLIDPLISYQSIVLEKDYDPYLIQSALAGVLPRYDIPDLVAAMAPAKLLLINMRDQLGRSVSILPDNIDIQRMRRGYQLKDADWNLEIRSWADEDPAIIFGNWLK